jgi:hypothetical protein
MYYTNFLTSPVLDFSGISISSSSLRIRENILTTTFVPYLLCPWGEKTLYPLNRRMGRLLSLSGYFREGKNLLSLSGSQPWIIQTTAE